MRGLPDYNIERLMVNCQLLSCHYIQPYIKKYKGMEAWGWDVPCQIRGYTCHKGQKVNLIHCDTHEMVRVAPEEPP